MKKERHTICIEKGIEIHFIVATNFSYLLWIASQYALPMLFALSFSSFHFFSMPYRNSQGATWPVPYRKWDFILKILWKISSSSRTIVIEYGQQKTCYIERQEIQAITLFIMTKRWEKPAVLSKTETEAREIAIKEDKTTHCKNQYTITVVQ